MKQAASEQERLIGELAARGFGAQFLYKPLPYYKGQPGHLEKEPFDLAWVVEGFVALFYLNESTASLEKQIRHNAKGPYGFIRLWATGEERFALPGKNIFGDEIPARVDLDSLIRRRTARSAAHWWFQMSS